MPTADEFTRLAAGFDREATRLLDAVRALELRAPSAGLVGWSLVTTVDVRTQVVTTLAREAARSCGALADECRQRAMVCRTYTEAHRRYVHDLDAHDLRRRTAEPGDPVGRPPRPPARPAAWADRG